MLQLPHDDFLTSCFSISDEKGTLKDASLVRMFLMMHPWYIPSIDMAKKLVLKYPSPLVSATSEMYNVLIFCVCVSFHAF